MGSEDFGGTVPPGPLLLRTLVSISTTRQKARVGTTFSETPLEPNPRLEGEVGAIPARGPDFSQPFVPSPRDLLPIAEGMEPQRTDSTSVASTPAVASTTREASSPNCLAPGPIARDDAQPPAVPDPSQSRPRADSRAVDTVQTIDGGGTPPPHHSRKLGAVDQPLRLRTTALGLVDCENSPIDDSVQLRPDPTSRQRRLGTTKFFNASKGKASPQ